MFMKTLLRTLYIVLVGLVVFTGALMIYEGTRGGAAVVQEMEGKTVCFVSMFDEMKESARA